MAVRDYPWQIVAILLSGCAMFGPPATPRSPQAPHAAAYPPEELQRTQQEWRARLDSSLARLREQPEDAGLWAEAARAYEALGRWYASRGAWEHAVRFAPDSAAYRIRLAAVLHRLEYSRPALREVEHSLRLEQTGDALALKGRLLWEAGRRPESIDVLESAWRSQPPSMAAGLALSRWDLERGRTADAVERLRQVVRMAPESGAAAELLADGLARSGDVAGAINELERVVQRGGGAEGYFRLAALYHRHGDSAAAEASFASGRRLAPEHPLAGRLDDLLQRPADALERSPYRPIRGEQGGSE